MPVPLSTAFTHHLKYSVQCPGIGWQAIVIEDFTVKAPGLGMGDICRYDTFGVQIAAQGIDVFTGHLSTDKIHVVLGHNVTRF
ncbi:hypothetical protein [Pseudomonas chlororaphis]|uniref:hypothetical protein n=1 Tax=Pseudomonas chlororaphis TaxID=587753 RepID=UPI0014740B6F|nr:hypothetical protein [Pseudomonas chlororaphis]NNB43652.1 hypothetical protein [Pseudomonas chlororaphis]QQX56848.1 hypothetical protein JHW28_19855 [Pseudomonas chlororaphis subsp. aurantiaca]UVE43702.1 hypothetical protein KS461_20145 [Pseudomonas chlororaphis]WMI97992.1 hypothetical protein RBU55_20805 [Pseudomonas chlororaphis subsp. aurantiaca]